MQAVDAFLDFAEKEYNLKFPQNIKTDGKQARYKMPSDKGCQTSGFVTFHMDDNPVAIFGDWKKYGKECFKWFYRDQKELSKKEREEFKSRMREARDKSIEEDRERKRQAAIKAGQLWQLSEAPINYYEYLNIKQVGAYGVKFFDAKVAFEFFASEERKAQRDAGEITVFNGVVMAVPVQNQQGQLVSLQQISQNGKFKGFLPNGTKKGCFHVIHGTTDVIFEAEGYATGATIHELTGCTVYIAFDCGNLEEVALAISAIHPYSLKLIASDDDRFTTKPINNPGQTKAISICDKTDFHNLKPKFKDDEVGTDWNDLLKSRTRQSLYQEICAVVLPLLKAM